MSSIILRSTLANTIPLDTSVVLAGKNGAIGELGVSYINCTNYSVGINDIVFTLANLHLIYDDYYSAAATSNSSNIYLQAPITQFAAALPAVRNSGYYNYNPYITLELKSSNKISNTITVWDKTYNNVKQSSLLLDPVFKLRIYQPELLGNTIYISGGFKSFDNYENVVGVSGTSTIDLPFSVQYKNDVKVFLDEKETTDFTWPVSGNTSRISLSLDGTYSNIRLATSKYMVPAFEANDRVTLAVAANNYTISNISYQLGSSDPLFSTSLYTNNFFKVKLNKNIYKVISGSKLVNISKDLIGRVTNNTLSNITISYDSSYPYAYNLANTSIYYLYKSKDAVFYNAGTDELNKIKGVPSGSYLLRAANINKYNRTSPQVYSRVSVNPIALSKVDSITVTEDVFVDSVAGAVINATIAFPPITDRDVVRYDVRYLVAPTESVAVVNDDSYSRLLISQNTAATQLVAKVNNLYRGRESNSNSLYVTITPLNGVKRGFTKSLKHLIVGKITKPNGLKTFLVSQNNDSLVFSWSIVLTADGYIADLDAKEIEIREYPASIDVSSSTVVETAWSVALEVARVSYTATNFILPASKYGTFTYLARVRDTSDLESTTISAFVITIEKPDNIVTYKAYNETNAAIAYAYNGPVLLNNSNLYPEFSFSSVRQSNTDGFVVGFLKSTHTDNANGSSSGFSVVANSDSLTTGLATYSEYITPIRDLGAEVRGAVKIDLGVTINNQQISFNNLYETIFSGVSDYQVSEGYAVSGNVLVDNAFGGIGYYLGYGNANAATVSYNTYHRTLTSGGPYGNVYAIRSTSSASYNANSYAKIAGVLRANVIELGEVFNPTGNSVGSNNYQNVTYAGNSYELVNLAQFVDPDGNSTFLGPIRNIECNVFIRYATANVFYTAAANGVVGEPGHGNTNGLAFSGVYNSDPETAWLPYLPSDARFRYFQIKLEISNREPDATSVLVDRLRYQVDIRKKIHSNTITIPASTYYQYDYTYLGLLESPVVTVQKINNSNTKLVPIVASTSNTLANIYIINSDTNTIYSSGSIDVSVQAIGI